MKKFILLIALSAFLCSAPGYTVGLQRKFEAEWQKARADAARADARWQKARADAARADARWQKVHAAEAASEEVTAEEKLMQLDAQVEQAEEDWNLLCTQTEAATNGWNAANALMAQFNAKLEAAVTQRDTVNKEWGGLNAQTTVAAAESDNALEAWDQAKANALEAWDQAKANADTKEVDEPEEYPAAIAAVHNRWAPLYALAEAARKRWVDAYARWGLLYAQTEAAKKRWNAADAETARAYALAEGAYAQREACVSDIKTVECKAAHKELEKLNAQVEDATAQANKEYAGWLRVQEEQAAQKYAPKFTMFRPIAPETAAASEEVTAEEKLAHLKAQEEQAAKEWEPLKAQTEADATNKRKGANANFPVDMQRDLLDSRTAKECETAREKWEKLSTQLEDTAAQVYKDADWWEEEQQAAQEDGPAEKVAAEAPAVAAPTSSQTPAPDQDD